MDSFDILNFGFGYNGKLEKNRIILAGMVCGSCSRISKMKNNTKIKN